MQTSIIFLTAKSKEIGIGHFSRICKIAEACASYFTLDSTLWLLSGSHEDSSVFNRVIAEQRVEKIFERFNLPEFVIFDLHFSLINQSFKEILIHFKKSGTRIIGIDCSLELSSLVDIIWIPSFFIKAELKQHIPPSVIYGWDTYLNPIKSNENKWQPGTKILVLTGGSDVTKQGKILPSLIEEKISNKMNIDWVQGPYSDPPLIPTNSIHEWSIHKAPSGICHLIEKTNYAITLYGVSFFELMSYGIPTIVYSPYLGRDDSELEELSLENICIVSKDASDAVGNLSQLIPDKEKSFVLSKNSLSRLSTSGLLKILKIIESMKRSIT